MTSSNMTEFEFQKIADVLKNFSPDSVITFPEELKTAFDNLTSTQLDLYSKINAFSSEYNQKSEELSKEVQSVDSRLNQMKQKIHELERKILQQIPSDVSARYFEPEINTPTSSSP